MWITFLLWNSELGIWYLPKLRILVSAATFALWMCAAFCFHTKLDMFEQRAAICGWQIDKQFQTNKKTNEILNKIASYSILLYCASIIDFLHVWVSDDSKNRLSSGPVYPRGVFFLHFFLFAFFRSLDFNAYNQHSRILCTRTWSLSGAHNISDVPHI